ncbi:MAG: mandelate racemase/muconate lactonizing enzyme family protein [Caldilineaceae bacterium]|nr:mandelate racemase/muconate lactonizing enzyme family protein [Caldilineaceae bacterium]
MLRSSALPTTPVMVAGIDLLRVRGKLVVRAMDTDGAVGYAFANSRLQVLVPILEELVIPYFVGKDARQLAALVDGVYAHQSNYKLAGLAFWNCVSHVEFALLDLLGKLVNKPVAALFGEILRTEIPIYLSSMRRDTTPEAEVAWVGERLAATGANAVKLKIGGRMSNNADAWPGRTEALVALARKTWGDEVAIYVDANSSYDAETAIAVGRILEAHGVGWLEEPCPFEDYEATKQVADALEMPVVGGEQDTNIHHFAWMIRNRGVNMVQPDLLYNGGMIRTLRVAKLAEAADMKIAPHSPKNDPLAAYLLHFAAIVPNLGPHQEWRAVQEDDPGWYSPVFSVQNGNVALPTGPGWGIIYDERIFTQNA